MIIDDRTKEVYKQNEGGGVNSGDHQVALGLKDYINEDLKLDFIMSDEDEDLVAPSLSSICDYVYISYSIGAFKKDFGVVGTYPLTLSYLFCDFSEYRYTIQVPVNGLTNYRVTFRRAFNNILDKQWKYDFGNRVSIKFNPRIIRFTDFNQYLDTCKSLNKYEGIYELINSNNAIAGNLKLGIYNDNGSLKLVYFDGATYKDDWIDGEIKGTLTKTKSEIDFLLLVYGGFKNQTRSYLTFINDNIFEYKVNNEKWSYKFIRLR